MVVEEREEVARRVVEGAGGIAGPHRRHQRPEEARGEVLAEADPGDERPERLLVALRVDRGGQDLGGVTVEPLDLGQHPQVREVEQVANRGEEAARAERTRILDAPLVRGPVDADRHAHVGVAGLDAELGEEAQQRRVGPVVVDDEPGVDGDGASPDVHKVGVGMTAEPVVGLVQRDVAAG